MFKNLSEIREFMEWASKKGVSRVKIGDVEFEISPSKLAEEFINGSEFKSPEPGRADAQSEEEDDVLYWSSGG